jgi:hypothetical protein
MHFHCRSTPQLSRVQEIPFEVGGGVGFPETMLWRNIARDDPEGSSPTETRRGVT